MGRLTKQLVQKSTSIGKGIIPFVVGTNTQEKLIYTKLEGKNYTLVEENTFEGCETNYLDLSNNNFEMVDGRMFRGLNNVRLISISHNNICFVTKDALEYLPQIQTIFISYNPITFVHPSTTKIFFKEISHVDIEYAKMRILLLDLRLYKSKVKSMKT